MAVDLPHPPIFLAVRIKAQVITGFNTDIEFEGVTYHVQTEDKGLSSPFILSLVYDGGTILASKRIPYDDLLESEFDEHILAERLQKQHRLMCAAVQAGRIEDLKKMSEREARSSRNGAAKKSEAINRIPQRSSALAGAGGFSSLDVEFETPIPKPFAENFDELGIGSLNDPLSPAIDAIDDDELVIPDDAVEIVSQFEGTTRPRNNKLVVEILGDTSFKGGDRRTVTFLVCRGNAQKVMPNAQVMVKIIGSNFRPQIFHSTTDGNGLSKVTLQFPNFTAGRAALLVRAISDGEEVEVRRSIAHG